MPKTPQPRRSSIDGILERLDTTDIGRRDLLKVLGIAAGVVAAGGVVGGVGRGLSGSSGVVAATDKIAILNASSDSEYNIIWQAGALGAAEQLGLKATALDAHWDSSTQRDQFEQVIAQKYGAAVVLATDGAAVKTLGSAAARTGTYFGTSWDVAPWFTPWDSGKYFDLYSQADEFTAETAVVTRLLEELNGEGSIIRIGGALGHLTEGQRKTAALDALARFPAVVLEGELNTNWSPQAAQEAATALLSRYPQTTGIIAVNDDVATGAVAAVRGIGKTPGKDILIIGANGSNEGIKRVASGTQLATTGNSPAYCGYQVATRLYDVQRGWTPDAAERMLQWQSIIIDSTNVQPYKARYVDQDPSKQINAKLLSRIESPDNWDTQFLTYPIEDLERWFGATDKPPRWQPPEEWVRAHEDGSFDRVRERYADHFRTDPLGPTPDDNGFQEGVQS